MPEKTSESQIFQEYGLSYEDYTPDVVSPNASLTGVEEVKLAEPAAPSPSVFAPEKTQRGFVSDLLPELQRLLSSGVSREDAGMQILDAVRTAFKSKNMLYNILIQHQSSFQNDHDFLANIEDLIGAWMKEA